MSFFKLLSRYSIQSIKKYASNYWSILSKRNPGHIPIACLSRFYIFTNNKETYFIDKYYSIVKLIIVTDRFLKLFLYLILSRASHDWIYFP